jgi:peptide/nickel transport system substrate-binding protein
MDWKRFDWARRNASTVELDLIEHYASGKIGRRDFLRRAGIIGLGAPMVGVVLAACGDSDSDGGATETTAAASGGEADAPAGGNITAAIQFGDANSGLDPLNMLDLGTYSVLSQSFEYLVGLGPDGNIANTALATDWSPNEDGSQWTFTLREGVTWQDGSPFTSADVAATIDRMVVAGAGLAGVVSEGAVDSSDPSKVVVNLDSPNGNLPVLISIYNPQSLITPADYSDGTTLDARKAGTGPWVLDSFNATTFESTFTPNPNWWGGTVKLDSITLKGFESAGTMTAAMAAREVDMLQSFNVIDGGSLLNDDAFTVLKPPSANHRQLWFNTQEGQFTDPRARQAVGYALNRAQLVATLYEGQALVGNDHPVHPSLPFFDSSAVDQRPLDPEMSRQLLADAGFPDGITTTLQIGNLQEIPDMAAIIEQNLAEGGINASVSVTDNSDFYGQQWCPGASWGADADASPGKPCGSSSEIGIVDYGHRPTPDVYFGRALQTDGDWNSSNYASSEFDQLFKDYQAAVDVEAQTTAISGIQQVLHADTPACYPIFFDYLSGHDASVKNVQVTALGHMQFQNATKA